MTCHLDISEEAIMVIAGDISHFRDYDFVPIQRLLEHLDQSGECTAATSCPGIIDNVRIMIASNPIISVLL